MYDLYPNDWLKHLCASCGNSIFILILYYCYPRLKKDDSSHGCIGKAVRNAEKLQEHYYFGQVGEITIGS